MNHNYFQMYFIYIHTHTHSTLAQTTHTVLIRMFILPLTCCMLYIGMRCILSRVVPTDPHLTFTHTHKSTISQFAAIAVHFNGGDEFLVRIQKFTNLQLWLVADTVRRVPQLQFMSNLSNTIAQELIITYILFTFYECA